MKATGLMLGDWVNPLNKAIEGPCRVLNLGEGIAMVGKGAKEWIANTSELEGIPLTSELLQKNGFVYNDLPFVQGWEGYGICIYNGRVNCGQNVSMVVNCLHELQHIFKMCEIDIELRP